MEASRAEARFVGVPPHTITTAPSRAIDNAVSTPIGGAASVGPMPAGRSASADGHTAERRKAASALRFRLTRVAGRRTEGKRGRKPCIRGMRITVYDVLEWLASGMSTQEIIEDSPELTQEDIKACLAFAANREHQMTSNWAA